MRIAVLFIIYYSSVVYGFLNPLFGLLFYVHITILRPESLAWGAPVFGRLHLMAATFALMGYLARRGQGAISKLGSNQRINIFLFGSLLAWLTMVSALAEVSPETSFEKLAELVKIFALCFLFSRVVTLPEHFNFYVWVIGFSFGLLGFWGFLQGLAGNPRLDDIWPGGSNYVAAQLALMIPLVVAKAMERGGPWYQKPAFIGSMIAMTLCLIFTESRGGFLGFAIALGVLTIGLRQRLQVLLFLFVGFMIILPWVPAKYFERVTSTFAEEGERDESSESRFVTWSIAIHIWRDYPIKGVGLGNFSPVKETYADEVKDLVPTQSMHDLIFNRERHPHGLYQGMLAESGTVGLALFLGLFLFNVFRFVPRDVRLGDEGVASLSMKIKATQAGLCGFAVSAVFGDFQYIETFYWQIFFLGALRDQLAQISDQYVKIGYPQTNAPIGSQSHALS